MYSLMIFSDFENVFDKYSGPNVQRQTKKYGKRAKKPLLGLVLIPPNLQVQIMV